MKKLSILVLLIAGLLYGGACASVAYADDEFVVLQKSHSGLWSDAADPSAGFDIQVIRQGGSGWAWVAMYANARAPDELPFWLVAYPGWRGVDSGIVPLYRTDRLFDSVLPADLVQAGTLHITSLACDSLTADVLIWQRGGNIARSYTLSPITLTSGEACIPCAEPDFSPATWECTP